jgi:hypothetical protein
MGDNLFILIYILNLIARPSVYLFNLSNEAIKRALSILLGDQ